MTDWIQTYTGRKVHFYPKPEEIDIRDIAMSLAKTSRFRGHNGINFTVAQHCYHCSMAVNPKYALEALLHDASEAYLCDMPAPFKKLMPEYQEAEERFEKAIEARFKLDTSSEAKKAVKEVDLRMLVTEKLNTLNHQLEWTGMGYEGIKPLDLILFSQPHIDVYQMFLNRAKLLMKERDEQ